MQEYVVTKKFVRKGKHTDMEKISEELLHTETFYKRSVHRNTEASKRLQTIAVDLNLSMFIRMLQ